MEQYTGDDLISWGFKAGPAFPKLLEIANSLVEHELPVPQIIDILNEEYEEMVKAVVEVMNESPWDQASLDKQRNRENLRLLTLDKNINTLET